MWGRRYKVDQRDLQGNILCGYGNDFGYALYLFLKVGDGRAGRAWLRKLCEQVTDAVPWDAGYKPLSTLNVAFTWGGLASFGVPRPILETFPHEFRDGMGEESRARFLGDTGESRPDAWDQGLRHEDPPDVLVTLKTRDPVVLAERAQALRRELATISTDLQIVHTQRAELLDHEHDELPYSREHFGFADGFSQPAIRGNAGPDTRKGMGTPLRLGWKPVAPGEFVLGYPGEDGLLPAAPVEPLGRSGSYMVVRKLEQHVDRFNGYLAHQAGERYVQAAAEHKLGRAASEHEVQDWLSGQIVGRWKDGRSLAVSKDPGAPATAPSTHPMPSASLTDGVTAPDKKFAEGINRFRYHADRDGYGCPLGSHVRRANPRDGFGWQGRLTKRHRIIRRGMPYGPEPDDARRGLMFVCWQASIARQFEVIQGHWLNDGDVFWLGRDKDMMTVASADSPNGDGTIAASVPKMTVPIEGGPPLFLRAPEDPFVTTRGGGYFFAPGLAALRALASAFWR